MRVFTVRTVRGAGRGKELTYPTINVDLRDVPEGVDDGIYACWMLIAGENAWREAAVHVGPRPVFQEDRAFEVHVLDAVLPTHPEKITILLLEPKIRDVQNFPSVEALKAAIAQDIVRARAMLATHAPGDQSAHRS